ncbi:MAG: putative toxin-antitoxin system toxin component, PIN family [archaeon]
MNVTFDNNVLLSSTLWDGSVSQKLLFDLIRRGDIKICVSNEILDDYKKVLKRDFEYAEGEVATILKTVYSFVTIIEVKEKIQIVFDDSDDDAIISCAVASESKYVITYDEHLLKIKQYKEIRIITPEAARAII